MGTIVGFMFDLMGLDIDHDGWAYCLIADRCLKDRWKLIAQERFVNWKVNGLGDGGMAYGGAPAWSYQVLDAQTRASLADYVIPDKLLENVRNQKGGKIPASVFLLKNDYMPLVEMIEKFLDDIEAKGENIDAVITFPKTIQSLVTVAKRRGLKLLVFEAGPLRFPGYLGTAYLCEGDPHWAGKCDLEKRYQEFVSLWPKERRLLSNREILAVMLRDEFLPYLKLYGIESQWEALVCGNYVIDPLVMSESSFTQMDLLEKAKKEYGENFHFRPDPGDLHHVTFKLPEEKIDLDMPNIFSLIRSRHILVITGNIVFDALLWGKAVHCMEKKSDLYEFCQSGIQTDYLLNYYTFAFLVPMELATTNQYLRWRLTEPDELEIYQYHLEYYLSKYGLDSSVFELSKEEAVLAVLSARGASSELAESLSRMDGESLDDFWSRAEASVGYRKKLTTSERIAEAQEQCRKAQEAAGQAAEQERQAREEMYLANEQIQTIQQQLMQARTQFTAAQEQAEKALMQVAEMQQEKNRMEDTLQDVLNSRSWRMTFPLRKMKNMAVNLWRRKQ